MSEAMNALKAFEAKLFDEGLRLEDWPEWQRLRNALSRPAVPEGWKLVPEEPTEEMLRMAIRTQEVAPEWTRHVGALGVAAETYSRYRAMLSATPEAPCSK